MDHDEFGECCFCGDACSPYSQACGSCMRDSYVWSPPSECDSCDGSLRDIRNEYFADRLPCNHLVCKTCFRRSACLLCNPK